MSYKFLRTDFDHWHEYSCLISNRIIYFGSEIYQDDCEEGGVDFLSTSKIIKNLVYLDNLGKDLITIYWNSPGGEWSHGMAIYDAIRGVRSKVNMICFGMISSMGTIVLQACDKRLLTLSTHAMIHDGTEMIVGEAKTAENWGDYSKRTRKIMYNIYLEKIKVKHPNFTLKKVEKMCSHDCIMSGQEFVDLGLADKVL